MCLLCCGIGCYMCAPLVLVVPFSDHVVLVFVVVLCCYIVLYICSLCSLSDHVVSALFLLALCCYIVATCLFMLFSLRCMLFPSSHSVCCSLQYRCPPPPPMFIIPDINSVLYVMLCLLLACLSMLRRACSSVTIWLLYVCSLVLFVCSCSCRRMLCLCAMLCYWLLYA